VRKHLTDVGIIRGYARLNTKINDLHKELRQILTLLTSPVKLTQNEKLILLSLPAHLIKTYFTLESQGKATAHQISQFTNKARAIESSYLCQLATMGYITKRRNSRIVIYSMKTQNCTQTEDTHLEPQPPSA
jgi:hypothetical protein